MKKIIGLALVATLPGGAPAAAEEAGTVLETVSVTATKTQKLVSEAPASVSVVTDKQIETKNVERIDDALKNVTGVYVNASGDGTPSAWNNQILMRGVPGYYRTGVMIDGQNINNGFSQGTNLSTVPVDNIEQIEVVPGPFSALYGGSAMGGVVNVITKAPTKREVILRGGIGSNQTHRESGTYRDKWSFPAADLGVVVNMDHSGSQGYIQDYVTKSASGGGGVGVTGWEGTTSPTGARAFVVGDKGNKGWVKDNLGLKFFIEPERDTKITAEAAYHDSATSFDHSNSYLRNAAGGVVPAGTAATPVTLTGAGANASVRASDFLAGPNGEEAQRYKLGYETTLWDDVALKLTAAHMRNDYWYITPAAGSNDDGGAGTYTDIPTNKTDLDGQLGIPLGTQHYVTTGVYGGQANLDKHTYAMSNWREDGFLGATTGEANGETLSQALYLQDEFSATDKVTFYVGARYDRWATSGSARQYTGTTFNKSYDERTKSALSPKLSAVFRPAPSTTLRAAWGKAFRTPSLSDMYSTWSSGSTIYWANPDLKPEKSRSWEFGGEHTLPTQTTFKATYFNSQIKDLIYSYTSGTNNNKVNAGGAHVQGIEGEVRQHLFGGVTAFANLTVQDSRVTNNSIVPTSVERRVTMMPDKMWNIGVEGEYKDLFGSLVAQHVSKVYSTNNSTDTVTGVPGAYDPYTLVNAKIGWNITESYAATFSIDNLFDKEYYESSMMPGRTFFLSLKAKY
ncbi:MAG: TonB-dependent receptor [Bacteroidota bacterium]